MSLLLGHRYTHETISTITDQVLKRAAVQLGQGPQSAFCSKTPYLRKWPWSTLKAFS